MELPKKSHEFSIPALQNFDEVESFLREETRRFSEFVLSCLVAETEKRWRDSSGVGFVSKGWRSRVVSTVLGEFTLWRRRFHNPKTGEYVIPFDLEFDTARETRAVKEMSVRVANHVSFAKASSLLALMGVHRSPKRVWRDLQEAGKGLDTQQAEATAHMYATGEVIDAKEVSHPLVAIEADGTFVKGRQKGQCHEVKLAIAYTEKVKKGAGRWELGNKQAWGGVLPSADFGQRLNFVMEQQYSISTAGNVVGRSDGGQWIGTVFDSFPRRVTHQLDLHHLVRNLQENVQDPLVLGECLAYAYSGDGKGLLSRLSRRAAHVKDSKSLNGALNACKYVRNNLERIDSLAAWRDAAASAAERKMYCRGSGAIERNISSHLCDRMKHRRMHWSAVGAHHMAMS